MRRLIALVLLIFSSLGHGYTSKYENVRNQAQEVTVALIGDTGADQMFGSVLHLVANENADVVMINGDLGYNSSPEKWNDRLKSSIDTSKYFVIGTLGNHDAGSKDKYLALFDGYRNDNKDLRTKCSGTTGVKEGHDIIAVDEVCTFGNVSIIASGIGLVLSTTYLENRLEQKLKNVPKENWSLAGYHYTVTSMNPGIKGDENTYKFFDLLRQYGAIGAQAHTHSGMASCPIASPFVRGAEVKCHASFGSDLEARFVAPGIGLFMDSSLGGKEIRNRSRCHSSKEKGCQHLVDLISDEGYTRTDGTIKSDFNPFGAMFIVFNLDGDPTKALAYYKSVDGKVVFKFNISREFAL